MQIAYLISSFSVVVAADQNKHTHTYAHTHEREYTQLGICIENQETVPTTSKCEKQTKKHGPIMSVVCQINQTCVCAALN